MPTLNLIGKEAVVDHHRRVPTRLLECDAELSFGDPEAGNLLVEGDNLEALKALLPRYRGQVKCIYIDPPYNTGNEVARTLLSGLHRRNAGRHRGAHRVHDGKNG